MNDYQSRFAGIGRVYGQAFSDYLQHCHIVVAGLGGVGSWAVEALARSGVGRLTLIDLDDIALSNSNRQLPATQSTIGRLKGEVLAARVVDINPACQVRFIDDFLLPENFEDYLSDAVDGVIDAIDSVNSKAALMAWCKRRKLALVSCGGAGGQIDPTQISVADITRAQQDPLLAKVRSLLRRDYQFSKNPQRKFGIDVVYSTEQLRYPVANGDISHAKPGAGSMRMDCQSGFGAAMVVTNSFAMFAVATLFKRLQRRMPPPAAVTDESPETRRYCAKG